MRALWLRLGAKYQRLAVIGVVGLAGYLVAAASSTPSPQVDVVQANCEQKRARHIFTDRTPHETGIDNLSATVKSLAAKNEQLQETLALLQKSLAEGSKKKASQEAAVEAKVRGLELELEKAIGERSRLTTPDRSSSEPYQSKQHLTNGTSITQVSRPILKITTHSAATSKEKIGGRDSGTSKRRSSLPATSILSGILINGMDAPTSQASRREPVPALVRLQLDAILPNLARSDIKECFLLMAGYGNLSDDRAYLRGETIACVCEDGSTIEEPLDCYAVGEDGKTGIMGRIISKQGRAIANSMMAGFLGGASNAFGVNPVPTINLGGANKTMFQSVLSPEAVQGAAMQGAGQAMDRVAKFYLEMAENLFPVIEIDAGRQIDIIVKKGSMF